MRTYSLYVNFMRGLLPLVALVALAGVISWPLLNEWKEQRLAKLDGKFTAEDIALTVPAAGQPAQIQVTKPEFTGRDAEGRPYVVTASRVLQDIGVTAADAGQMKGKMTLEAPAAKMTLNDATHQFVTLQSAKGEYDPKAQTLALDHDVVLTHSDGYTLMMQNLDVDLVKGTSRTATPVSGQGPADGTLRSLEAESMELRDKGNHIILHGKSKLILAPQSPAKQPVKQPG